MRQTLASCRAHIIPRSMRGGPLTTYRVIPVTIYDELQVASPGFAQGSVGIAFLAQYDLYYSFMYTLISKVDRRIQRF